MVRVKSARTVACPVCGGEGFVHTEWFGLKPLPWSATECPECQGLGRVREVLEEVSGPEPSRNGHGAELLAAWVRAYREARRRGLSPEEAREAADGEAGEELPF